MSEENESKQAIQATSALKGLVRRERDAKLVLLRAIVGTYKYYGEQIEAWREVCSLSGVDTEEVEIDLLAVQSEAERLMEQLRVEIKALVDA